MRWLPLIFLALPAQADEVTLDDNPPISATWFARVIIENTNGGSDSRPYTLDTIRGPVTIRYTMTPNGPCYVMPVKGPDGRFASAGQTRGCEDIIEVVSLPAGVSADPMSQVITEGETGQIFLQLQFVGF